MVWAVGGTNLGENISSRIETPWASSNHDINIKSQWAFQEDFFLGASFET